MKDKRASLTNEKGECSSDHTDQTPFVPDLQERTCTLLMGEVVRMQGLPFESTAYLNWDTQTQICWQNKDWRSLWFYKSRNAVMNRISGDRLDLQAEIQS